MYKLHKEITEEKILKVNNKIKELQKDISLSISLLGYYKVLLNNSVLNYEDIKNNRIIFKNDNEFKPIVYLLNTSIENRNNISNILTTIMNKRLELKELEEEVNYLSKIINVPYNIFKDIILSFNKYFIREVIMGQSMTFGSNTRSFKVMLFNRKFNRIPVDWNESLKTLLNIAKEQEEEGLHTLYTDYSNKTIKKNEFIEKMKPFTYDKDNNPNGRKWIVARTESQFAVIRWGGASRVGNSTKLYRFRPSNYINTKSRSQVEFAETAKTEDDILNSNLLGFRDKLNIMIRFNPSIKLKYDDLQFN